MKIQKANSLENITWSELENKTYQLKRFISPGNYRSQDGGLVADKQGALSGLGETVNSHRIPVSKVFGNSMASVSANWIRRPAI